MKENKIKGYVGLDISSTASGVCVLGEDGDLLFFYLIQPNKKLNIYDRFINTYKQIVEILSKIDVIGIGIETPSFYSKGRVIDLARGNGYIYLNLKEAGYNIEGFVPTQVTKYLLNGAKKKEVDVTNTPKQMGKKPYLWEGLPQSVKDDLYSSSYKKWDDLVDAYGLAKLAKISD